MKRMRFLLFVVLTAVAASAEGQSTTRPYRAPRAEGGRPDLQGVWNFNTAVPLQRPATVAGRKVFTKEEFDARRATMRNLLGLVGKFLPVEDVGFDWMDTTLHVEDLRTSLVTYPENGRLPATLEGVKRVPQLEDFIAALADSKGGTLPPSVGTLLAAFQGGKKDSYTDFMMSERCLLDASVPMMPQLDDNYVQIIQGTDHVVLLTDFWRRIVALDGKPQPGDAQRTWSGTSRGHWEGDTLVVETRNFNDRLPSFAGAGISRDKVVTERFTRTSPAALEYAATIVDPKTFTDRIALSFPLALVDVSIHEAGCHEGNYSLRNALSAARKGEEAKQAQ